MLMKCPECDLQVSDKAITCPHCGYPVQKEIIEQRLRPRSKHKRLPNGFGQIKEIKDQNLRKPFRAMVTVGKTPEGKPICKIVGYQKTYNEAYEMLVEYHKNPYDLSKNMTVKELFEKWYPIYEEKLKEPKGGRSIKAAWNYVHPIHNMNVSDVRVRHLKNSMENGYIIDKDGSKKEVTANMKTRIKSMFNLMFDFALEYELVTKNYARDFKLSKEILNQCEEERTEHIDFTNDEMNTLWNNVYTTPYVDILLIQCYTGLRPQEIGLVRLSDIDWEMNLITTGMKTDAGYNRPIPINSGIKDLIMFRYNQAIEIGSEYVFNCVDSNCRGSNKNELNYNRYRKRVNNIVSELNLNPEHRCHDGRVEFITLAKKYKMDEYAIKYIAGHEVSDITEKVYTRRNIDWLKEEMEKIKIECPISVSK